MLIPAAVFYLLFCYLPIFGVILAFKTYKFNVTTAVSNIPVLSYIAQILKMEWAGLKWFEMLWSKPDFWRAFANTLIISFGKLITGIPAPLILALLMNEMRHNGLKRFFQTTYTFPHFLSWVLVVGVLNGILRPEGILNQLIAYLGGQKVSFMSDKASFRTVLYITNIWKSIGWNSIIYLAAISGIDPTLYEASMMDGANRWHNIIHITWPSIKSTFVILLILQCGQILNAGFDQVFNMYNAAVMDVADIIDTYIYRYAFQKGQNFSFSVASGLFKSVVNFALLSVANFLSKKLGETSLF